MLLDPPALGHDAVRVRARFVVEGAVVELEPRLVAAAAADGVLEDAGAEDDVRLRLAASPARRRRGSLSLWKRGTTCIRPSAPCSLAANGLKRDSTAMTARISIGSRPCRPPSRKTVRTTSAAAPSATLYRRATTLASRSTRDGARTRQWPPLWGDDMRGGLVGRPESVGHGRRLRHLRWRCPHGQDRRGNETRHGQVKAGPDSFRRTASVARRRRDGYSSGSHEDSFR